MKKIHLLKLCFTALLAIPILSSCTTDETTDEDIEQTNDLNSGDTDGLDDSDGSQEESPTISNQTFTVAENTLDTTIIGSVVANTTSSSAIDFSLRTDVSALFEITADGEISLQDNKNLDFETATSHSIVVEVSTDGVNYSEATITINVTDVAELDFRPRTFSVQENLSGGQYFIAPEITDGDKTYTYTLVSGNEEGNFRLSQENTEGVITVVNAFDFEGSNQYVLTIRVSDGVATAEADFTFNITDEFADEPFDVYENINTSTVIVTMPLDEFGTNYSISIQINDNDLFEINNFGEISLKTGRSLDYETNTTHTITVLEDYDIIEPFTMILHNQTRTTTIQFNVLDVAELVSTIDSVRTR